MSFYISCEKEDQTEVKTTRYIIHFFVSVSTSLPKSTILEEYAVKAEFFYLVYTGREQKTPMESLKNGSKEHK